MFHGILRVAELGSRFDLGTPIAGAVGDLIHGSGRALFVSLDCGYTDLEIRGILADEGIETWAPMEADGDLSVRVAEGDRDRAVAVLAGYGIEAG